ncbi:MAG: hypothetical protein EAY70_08265 [Sphingomonadales bacterium]|nr:MAG: hypothetical protein EAY70_08265 [Sphingomonadales bacterium]
MDKRSVYRAGALAGGSLLALFTIFGLDIGSFVWGIALMTLSFAVASYVTPPEDSDTSER